MPCIYCNDDPEVSKNCYCRPVKPFWDASDLSPDDAVDLTPEEQRLFERNLAMLPALERLEEKITRNAAFGSLYDIMNGTRH